MSSTAQAIEQAVQLQRKGQLEQAEQIYQQVLRTEPNNGDAWHLWGMIAYQREQMPLAIERIERALACDPRGAPYHSNLGLALHAVGRCEEAIIRFRAAASLSPEFADAHNNLGVALREAGRLDEAITAYEQAVRLMPDDVSKADNLAVALRERGRPEESLAILDRLLKIRPHDPDLHFNRAQALLLAGDYRQGWPEYEYRWDSQYGRSTRRTFEQPLWDGQPLAGRTILLYGEQGLGDTLQFVRYAPLVKERGGNVLLECDAALVKLSATAPGVGRVIARGEKLPSFDVQAPLLSLPRVFKTTLETIPSPKGYLKADPALKSAWRDRLKGVRGRKLGIVWQGSSHHLRDRFRSFSPQLFAGLARVPNITLVSLQKGLAREQAAQLAVELPSFDATDRLTDFAETAALVSNLDLLITCDSAPAHLAGALGVPTMIALPLSPDWRWLLHRSDTPWYASLRLFRQPSQGDWESVFKQIEAVIVRKLAGK